MLHYISIIKSNCNSLAERQLFVLRRFVVLIPALIFFNAPVSAEENGATPTATVWYKELAAQGDVDAKYSLGMMNETGWGVPVDLNKSVRWYREAAREGHAEAQLRLGMLYYLGLGSKQSKLKGESWIRKSAKQGHEFAESLNDQLFGLDVQNTINTEKILNSVREIYLADEKNALPELNRLIKRARQETELQEQDKGKTTIRERREERNEKRVVVESVVADGRKDPSVKKEKSERIESVIPEFVDRESVVENRTLSKGNIETIRLQAKRGQASAQYNLGRMYELGIKLPVNKEKALSWYEKAAHQGYPDAEYRLAIALLYGINTEKNESLGRHWLASAARHGHQVASNLYDKIVDDERSLKSKQSVVVDWYLDRAIVGDAESALRLGKIYEHGWGVFPDAREAGKWYQKAIALGSDDAEKLLQQLSARLATGGELQQEKAGRLMAQSSMPSSWIAYLIAIFVAAFIFFSPVLLKRQKKKSELLDLDDNVNYREEPPA